jgi:hypothetical protein
MSRAPRSTHPGRRTKVSLASQRAALMQLLTCSLDLNQLNAELLARCYRVSVKEAELRLEEARQRRETLL